ncbi:unnamed protein product [Orchesella dallaii]|uniref:F-box domain-containing protein n=1 Tax=Orchesella dallaii TaxID=48710 RepID=A0ABP1QR55_9HEXA
MEEDFSEKKEEMIEDSASLEAKNEDVGVVGYSHFPGDNITEVWLNIFEKLDAEDKITLSKTCYELHDWVASKRTSFYFSQVVPVIALRTTKLKARELLQYASCILKCRTICKSWTSDFNRVFSAHPAHLRLCTEEDGADGGALDIVTPHISLHSHIAPCCILMLLQKSISHTEW